MSLMSCMCLMCMSLVSLHSPAKKGGNLTVVKLGSSETWGDLGLCLKCSIGMCLCLFYQWFSTFPAKKGHEKTLALFHLLDGATRVYVCVGV